MHLDSFPIPPPTPPQNFMTGIFIVIGNIDSLINMFSAIQWMWYGTAVFGVIIMRLTRPHIHRPFEVRKQGEGAMGMLTGVREKEVERKRG